MLTTADLIEDLKSRASIPDSQELFTPLRFVQILNSEMNTHIIPLIKTLNEEHFITYIETVLPSERDYIQFPSDSLGSSIVDLFIGDERTTLVPLREKNQYSSGVYLEGSFIRFINPSYFRNKTIRIYYLRRPSTLIETNKTSPITEINPGNLVDVKDTVSGFVVGSKLDVINHIPPFEKLTTVTVISKPNSKQYEVDDSSLLNVGNYLCPTGTSSVPQIPLESFELLSARASIKCLEAMKDTEGLSLALKDYEQMKQSLMTLLSPRIENTYKKVVSSTSLWNSW